MRATESLTQTQLMSQEEHLLTESAVAMLAPNDSVDVVVSDSSDPGDAPTTDIDNEHNDENSEVFSRLTAWLRG